MQSKSRRSRKVSNSDVASVRVFLRASSGLGLFLVLAVHYFEQSWFGLKTLLLFGVVSIAVGLIFSEVWLFVFTRTVGIERVDEIEQGRGKRNCSGSESRSVDPVVLLEIPLTWSEQLHLAVIRLLGLRLNALRMTYFTLAVVVPAVIYALKFNGSGVGQTERLPIYVICTLGLAAVPALISMTVLISAISAKILHRHSVASTYTITNECITEFRQGMVRNVVSWAEIRRLVQTSRIVALESDGVLALSLAKRAFDAHTLEYLVEEFRNTRR